MASIVLCGCRLAIVVFLLSCDVSAAFSFSRAKNSGKSSPDLRSIKCSNGSGDTATTMPPLRDYLQDIPSSELASLVRPAPQDPSGTFSHALEILASIQVSPSCNRRAASALLHSCQSIEGSESDAETSLEDYRSVYAAQLAMCEVESANSVKPQSCDMLMTTSKGNAARAGNIRKDRLMSCLQSLESRPQWWTSYSNNRQNAAVMCQAARIDIEKGKHEIWRLY